MICSVAFPPAASQYSLLFPYLYSKPYDTSSRPSLCTIFFSPTRFSHRHVICYAWPLALVSTKCHFLLARSLFFTTVYICLIDWSVFLAAVWLCPLAIDVACHVFSLALLAHRVSGPFLPLRLHFMIHTPRFVQSTHRCPTTFPVWRSNIRWLPGVRDLCRWLLAWILNFPKRVNIQIKQLKNHPPPIVLSIDCCSPTLLFALLSC